MDGCGRMGLESWICIVTKFLHYGTKHDGRKRNVNKTHLHANSPGLPQYITKTHNGASSQSSGSLLRDHRDIGDRCCSLCHSTGQIDSCGFAMPQHLVWKLFAKLKTESRRMHTHSLSYFDTYGDCLLTLS